MSFFSKYLDRLSQRMPKGVDLSISWGELDTTEDTAAPAPAEGTKPTNPKDMVGSGKLPLHLWPSTASMAGSIALLNGMLKYGRTNWRVAGVRSSIYYDAARRHLDAWFEGEETDPDDGVDHLAAALAGIAILIDSRAAGKLTDDRLVAGGYRAVVDDLTQEVTRLKALHKDRDPRHYTIHDRDLTHGE